MSNLVGNTAKAIETFELSERLARLEEQVAVKGMAAVLAGGAASGPTTCKVSETQQAASRSDQGACTKEFPPTFAGPGFCAARGLPPIQL